MFLIALSQHRARGAAGARTAVYRAAAVRWHAALFRGVDRAARNYALITILTVLVAALCCRSSSRTRARPQRAGAAILTVDALNMVLVAVLVFLVHAPGHAASPPRSAGGVALITFGAVSRLMGWGMRGRRTRRPSRRLAGGRVLAAPAPQSPERSPAGGRRLAHAVNFIRKEPARDPIASVSCRVRLCGRLQHAAGAL